MHSFFETARDITKIKPYFNQAIIAFIALFIFLFSIDLLVSGLKVIGSDSIRGYLTITSNPFIAFFIGILTTAIVQSSSTVTSILVALVASGSVDFVNAIPVVMGANIGTTLTSDIVSLGFINKKSNFKRAIAGATAHDFFNILTAAILLPLQISYNVLGRVSSFAAEIFVVDENTGSITSHTVNNVEGFANQYLVGFEDYVLLYLGIAVVLLFVSLKMLAKAIVNLVQSTNNKNFESYIFKGSFRSFTWGAALTAAIQSSSVTTAIVVPVVAVGKAKIEKAFYFIVGANLGTTITALLAALFKTEAALSLAFAHFFFNLIGVLIFLPFKTTYRLPVQMAKSMGRYTLKNRVYGFLYIISVFFLIPLLLIVISN